VYLNLDKSSLYIHTDSTFLKTSIADPDIMDYTLKTESNTTSNEVNKWSIIDFETLPSDLEYYQKINSIKSVNTVNVVAPSFTTMAGKKVVLSRHFYVKLNQPSDLSLLQQQAAQHNVLIKNQNQFMPLWYTLVCTESTIENSLEVANTIFETGLFASSSPNFMSIREEEQIPSSQIPTNTPLGNCPNVNDQLFGLQWNLENTGQVLPTVTATFGLDINACEAWNITTGNPNITVAVIDGGVQLDHPDLTNMHQSNYNTSSDLSNLWYHGTACAGIIGATHNNIGVSGISPDCQIMSINISYTNAVDIANGVSFAVQSGADVINNSWKVHLMDQDIINNAYNNALSLGRNGKGCVVVFSSGNIEGIIDEFPANSNDDFLVVGAMSPCGERKSPASCDLDATVPEHGSAFGSELDIMAPGVFIPTTDITGIHGGNTDHHGDYLLDFKGTSSAAPHVAAVAALILSVNPNLTNIEVNNIIESTAQKINPEIVPEPYSYEIHPNRPNGTWNNEMGYGLVDAHAAVVLAQSMNTDTVDLYTKDSPSDFGIEPNTNSNSTFLSQDIWVRHQQDGLTNFSHQTPLTNTDNYVYVRVRNNGTVASNGTDLLHLYWSNWGLSWSNHWIDHYLPTMPNGNDVLFGDEVGSINIPSIAPGEESVLEFNMGFYPYYPGLYGSYYRLLTRIVSTEDPILNETFNIHDNILNNNNIASKSVYVSNNNAPYSRTINTIHNPISTTKTYRLEFHTNSNEYGKAVYEEAEIHIELEQELFNAWNTGGKQGNNFKLTNNDHVIIVTNNHFVLDNISLQPNQFYSLNATFHFLTKELTNKNQFNYSMAQYDDSDNSLVDITHIEIQKETRTVFLADAGDNLETDKNETITLSAAQINEAAVYNWYDPEGNLIYTGKDLTVSADVTKQYKLEIVADADGFKDYDEVDVTVNQFYLNTIVPNPATNTVTINYKTIDIASAYLMVIGTNNNTSNNYIINTNLEQTTLDISNYPIGYYTIALVCNGDIVDAKTLIKN